MCIELAVDAGRFREFSFHCPIPGRRQTDSSSFQLEKGTLDEIIFSKKKMFFISGEIREK